VSALGDRRFRRLLVGQALSSFGDSALYLSLAIWAKDLTGSNAAAGAVFFALGLPMLFAPLAGQLVDRVNRRRLLIATTPRPGSGCWPCCWSTPVPSCGSCTPWPPATASPSPCSAGECRGCSRTCCGPRSWPAPTPASRPSARGAAAGQPPGAGIYAAFGGGALAVLDTATFAAAVAALASIRVQESPPDPGPRQPFRRELTAGFHHLHDTPMLGRIALVVAVAFSVLGFLESTDFAVIDHGLHRPASFFGVLNSVQGAGSVLGGLTAALVLRRLGEARTVGLALALDAAGALALTQASLRVVLAGFVVMGLAVSWLLVGYATARQRLTPPRLQGRVTSATDVLINGPQTVSIALGALLIDLVDYRILLLSIAAVLLACGGVLGIRPRQAHDHRRQQAGRQLTAPDDQTT
jgi:MFS family permease